jgi:hypothetical protein
VKRQVKGISDFAITNSPAFNASHRPTPERSSVQDGQA